MGLADMAFQPASLLNILLIKGMYVGGGTEFLWDFEFGNLGTLRF